MTKNMNTTSKTRIKNAAICSNGHKVKVGRITVGTICKKTLVPTHITTNNYTHWPTHLHQQCIFFFFFLSFNLLIGWQLSIWNCCKPFFSFLYNCQLLRFWRLAVSTAVEVFPRPFFPHIAPSRTFTTNPLCLIVCPIHEWRLFFFLNF